MSSAKIGLSQELDDFLRKQIASHQQLKTLLLMSDDPSRWWTLGQLSRATGGRLADLVQTLDPLVGAGLLVCRANKVEALYRFCPTNDSDAALVRHLRESNRESSLAVLRAVGVHAIERIRAEARKTFTDH